MTLKFYEDFLKLHFSFANMYHNSLFFNTLSLCFFLNVSDQVPHPHKRTRKNHSSVISTEAHYGLDSPGSNPVSVKIFCTQPNQP